MDSVAVLAQALLTSPMDQLGSDLREAFLCCGILGTFRRFPYPFQVRSERLGLSHLVLLENNYVGMDLNI